MRVILARCVQKISRVSTIPRAIMLPWPSSTIHMVDVAAAIRAEKDEIRTRSAVTRCTSNT